MVRNAQQTQTTNYYYVSTHSKGSSVKRSHLFLRNSVQIVNIKSDETCIHRGECVVENIISVN